MSDDASVPEVALDRHPDELFSLSLRMPVDLVPFPDGTVFMWMPRFFVSLISGSHLW